jgi:hypothetical protein
MSNQPGANIPQPTDGHRLLRLLGLAAVAAGVLLLMAAAFVVSYTGIHAIALSAGVSQRFARFYPVIFDAMLVIACAAVLSLRGAGLLSRSYAWLTMLVLLAAAAAADTLHATNTKLPHKPAAAAAAIIPWALVFIGFTLLLTMLRQARLRRAALAAAPDRAFVQPSGHVEVRHGIDELFSARTPADAPSVRYVPRKADPPRDGGLDLAIDTDPGLDDPASDEGHVAAAPGSQWRPAASEQHTAGYGSNAGYGSSAASAFSPAPTVARPTDGRTGTAPGPGRRADAGAVPEARRAPDTVPAPQDGVRPAPETAPEPDVKPRRGAGVTPKAGAAAKTSPRPKASPKREAAPVPEDGAAPVEPEASPAPEATPDPAAEPGPAPAPRFERVRSSPVPPEA